MNINSVYIRTGLFVKPPRLKAPGLYPGSISADFITDAENP
jgi:hypothetical protein